MKMSFVTHKQAVNASCESEIHGKSLCKISSTSAIFIVNSDMRCSTNLHDTAQNAVDPNPGHICLSVWKLSGLKISPFPGRISFVEVLNSYFAVYLNLLTNWHLNDGEIVILLVKSARVLLSVPWCTDHLWSLSPWQGVTFRGGKRSKFVLREKILLFNMVLLFFVKTSNMIIPYPSNRTKFCVSIRLLLRFGSYRIG